MIQPAWAAHLDDDDLVFVRHFVVASGSLKEMAARYGVSYPTVRQKLDRVIQKILLADDPRQDEFVLLVKRLALEQKVTLDAAKALIAGYKQQKES